MDKHSEEIINNSKTCKELTEKIEKIEKTNEELLNDIATSELKEVFDLLTEVKNTIPDYQDLQNIDDKKNNAIGRFLCDALEIKGKKDRVDIDYYTDTDDWDKPNRTNKSICIGDNSVWEKRTWTERKKRITGYWLANEFFKQGNIKEKVLALAKSEQENISDLFDYFFALYNKKRNKHIYIKEIDNPKEITLYQKQPYDDDYYSIKGSLKSIELNSNSLSFKFLTDNKDNIDFTATIKGNSIVLMLEHKNEIIQFLKESIENYKKDNARFIELQNKFNGIISPYLSLAEL